MSGSPGPSAPVQETDRRRFQLWLFVSYEDKEAKNLAIRAKSIFEEAEHSAWVWCRDARSGAYTHEEISENIRLCNRFVYVCTPASHASRGQRYERAQALTWDKKIDIIAFDLKDVSGEIRHANARITTPGEFDATCAALAHEFAWSPSLDKVAATEPSAGGIS